MEAELHATDVRLYRDKSESAFESVRYLFVKSFDVVHTYLSL